MRAAWVSLDGDWDFSHDDDDRGVREHWERAGRFDRRITVPFPPESPASRIGETGAHPICWYRRELTAEELGRAGRDGRYLLHFGAVDYQAAVWVDGTLVGTHRGGQSPFSFDITDNLDQQAASHWIVVRSFDDPVDTEAARGKQDWRPEPHAVWYERTSGIWQSVWLESVPSVHVASIQWSCSLPGATATAAIRLSGRPQQPSRVRVELCHDGRPLAAGEVESASDLIELTLALPRQRNGQDYEDLLWAPEHPTLIDATVSVEQADGSTDHVASYLGLRSVAVEHRTFLLNDRPYPLRSVLAQGYWPDSHLAAPSPQALRDEVALIKSLGFNSARVHQKAEDPRFLFWCDYLGLTVWAESAAPYQYSARAAVRLSAEWAELVERDRSHPCIVTWVPLNESWGVQHISHDPAQQAFARALADLTRALDPSRPVVSNDGWEHASSDRVTIHDYTGSPEDIRARYGSEPGLQTLLTGLGPAGRRLRACEPGWPQDAPVMLTEFGGIAYLTGADEQAWGYTSAGDADGYEQQLSALVAEVRRCAPLAGFCYTQLTDTRQEANGLCDENRRPKLPVETIRRIFAG
ncbi:MAG: glycoside hydrolase family 2 TIM barrel-domain containing protein [Propionicimonas sp.]|nr:glycoside hydrolase family 2 TIM barrel-domain containing protein [Propionicimonas sp.]